MKNTNRKGFTLVELVVVIAVIAILAGVLIATFASVIKKANDSARIQEIKADEIAQKAEDIIMKIEEANWFGWEDFEVKLVEKLTEAYKNNPLATIDSEEIKKAIKDAITDAFANINVKTTDLTSEQLKAIVENALGTVKYEGVTEAQVRAIVKAATSELTASQLTPAQVRAIVNAATTNNLTQDDVARLIGRAGLATNEDVNAAVETIKTALTGATSNIATKDQAQAILNAINEYANQITTNDLDDVITAKSLNIRIKNAGLTRANTPYEVFEAIGFGVVPTKTTILLSIEEGQLGFFVVNVEQTSIENKCGLNVVLGNNRYKYWTFSGSVNSVYSTYLTSVPSANPVVATGVGIDVGQQSISAITYNGSNEEPTNREVVIRTNCGRLVINEPNDVVKHYGFAEDVDIVAINNQSYHEYGSTSFLKIKTGHIVIENCGVVYGIYLAKTNEIFVDISIDISKANFVPTFYRDPVNIPNEGVLLCKLINGEGKYIYLIDNGTITQAYISSENDLSTAFANVNLVSDTDTKFYKSVNDLVNIDNGNGNYVPKKTEVEAKGESIISSTTDPSDPTVLRVYSKATLMALPQLPYTTKTIKIMNDIDMTGETWTPLGDSDDISITIEGNNHEIKGLSDSLVYRTGNVSISNLTIEMNIGNENIPVYAAAFVAWSRHYGDVVDEQKTIILDNCHAKGTIRATNTAGGLLGWISASSNDCRTILNVNNCSVNANVISEFRAGGVMGHCSYIDNSSYIRRTTVAGTITSTNETTKAAGGLIGYVAGLTDITIRDCEVTATAHSEFEPHYGEFTAVNDTATIIGVCDPAFNNSTHNGKNKLNDDINYQNTHAKFGHVIYASVMYHSYETTVNTEGFGIHVSERLSDILLDTVNNINSGNPYEFNNSFKHDTEQLASVVAHNSNDTLDEIVIYCPFTTTTGERLSKTRIGTAVPVCEHEYGAYSFASATQLSKTCALCNDEQTLDINTTLNQYNTNNNYIMNYYSFSGDYSANAQRTLATYTTSGTGTVHSNSWKGGEYTFNVDQSGTLLLRNNSNGEVVSKSIVCSETTPVSINSLIPNVEYSYAYLSSDNVLLVSGKVQANGTLRMFNVRNYSNFRDLGGLTTATGSLKYGKIIRGNSFDTNNQDAYADYEFTLKDLAGINVEVDLSGINVLGLDNYQYYSIYYYTEAFTSSETALVNALKKIINEVNAGNTVYVHCDAGRDRTGTVMLLIEGLLGVNEADIIKDYELTAFASSINQDKLDGFIGVYNYIMQKTGSNFTDKIARWLNANGVSYEAMNSFRTNMCSNTPDILTTPSESHVAISGLTFWGKKATVFSNGVLTFKDEYDAACATLYTTTNSGYELANGKYLIAVPEGATTITISDTSDLAYYYCVNTFTYADNTLSLLNHTGTNPKWGYSSSNSWVASEDHSFSFDVTGANYVLILVSKYQSTTTNWSESSDNINNTGISAYFTVEE